MLKNKKVLLLMITLFVLITTLSGCASWDRFKKSFSSEMGNGLNRDLKVVT